MGIASKFLSETFIYGKCSKKKMMMMRERERERSHKSDSFPFFSFSSPPLLSVVAGGLLLYEYDRGNKREEKKKEEKEKRKKRKETKQLEHLQRQDIFQKGVLQRLERLESLEKERSVGGGRRWW